jgi:thioredoxin reductase (NADPH)
MPEVIIVGNGPAGIAAALYTSRAGVKTIVIGRDYGSLGKAEQIENYFGFAQPVPGKELVENGIAQAKRLGVSLVNDEVIGMSYTDRLTVQTKEKVYTAEAVVLATGSSRATPKITGLKEFEGKGVGYCALCDGFFYKGKDVAVLGSGAYALHEAQELLPIVGSVTLLTNGLEPEEVVPGTIKVEKKKIESVQGQEALEKVNFLDGTSLQVSGLFVAVGVAGSGDLARTLGAQTEGTRIVVNENMETSIPGLYAAGDCTGGLLQISKAVYEGAKAGTEAVKFIQKIGGK